MSYSLRFLVFVSSFILDSLWMGDSLPFRLLFTLPLSLLRWVINFRLFPFFLTFPPVNCYSSALYPLSCTNQSFEQFMSVSFPFLLSHSNSSCVPSPCVCLPSPPLRSQSTVGVTAGDSQGTVARPCRMQLAVTRARSSLLFRPSPPPPSSLKKSYPFIVQ